MIFGPIKLVIKIAVIVMTVTVLYFAVTFVQIWLRGQEHSMEHAQAILVFGTTENNCVPGPELQARLSIALKLFNENRAPLVAVTGGRRPGDVCTESGASKSWLVAHGVPSVDILTGGGGDTWQNVSSIAQQLKARHATNVLTVTDPFHEFRAMAISSAQGLSPQPSPVSHGAVQSSLLWLYYTKETFEVGVARIVGFHLLSSWLHVG
jgi:uncharacterized SAM-binding protein YcdF (DUF218 family)